MSIDYSPKGGIVSGELRFRVAYESLSQGAPSAYGDSADVPSAPMNLWADFEFLEGAELMRAHEVHEQAKVRIKIRYNPAVNSAGRFVYEGQNYYPASVIPDPLKRRMVCICYVRPQENVT
jgi:SPP1 family predicted phage head-tail adaptor